jgi:hypothetical protein
LTAVAIDRRFTIKDFTALRAFVQRIEPAVVARTNYDPDDDAYAATPVAMQRHLNGMLDSQVQPTAATFRIVTEAVQLAAATPRADHPVGA